MNLIETNGLCKRYGKAMCVQDLDSVTPNCSF